MPTKKVSVDLAPGEDNALTFDSNGKLFAPKAEPLKQVQCKQVPLVFPHGHTWYELAPVHFPGVTAKTHLAWANVPLFKGWFEKGHANSKMVYASAVIGDASPGVVTVILTRPNGDWAFKKEEHHWLAVFVADR